MNKLYVLFVMLWILIIVSSCSTKDFLKSNNVSNKEHCEEQYEECEEECEEEPEVKPIHHVIPDDSISGLPEQSEIIIEDTFKNETEIEDDVGDNIENTFQPVFSCEPISEHIKSIIKGNSYKENTPFDYSELCYLVVTYYNFNHEDCIGELIVASQIGEEVLDIFKELYENKFPIEKIKLIDFYDANDDLSMSDNNTSAFNFRYIKSTKKISNHGYGIAIDINPVQNPYVSGDMVFPPEGVEYLDRSNIRKGMIVKDDVCYNAFISRGWIWGGDWETPKDFQHFEKSR